MIIEQPKKRIESEKLTTRITIYTILETLFDIFLLSKAPNKPALHRFPWEPSHSHDHNHVERSHEGTFLNGAMMSSHCGQIYADMLRMGMSLICCFFVNVCAIVWQCAHRWNIHIYTFNGNEWTEHFTNSDTYEENQHTRANNGQRSRRCNQWLWGRPVSFILSDPYNTC